MVEYTGLYRSVYHTGLFMISQPVDGVLVKALKIYDLST